MGEIRYDDTFTISISVNVNGVVENIFQGRINDSHEDDDLYGYSIWSIWSIGSDSIEYINGSWNKDLIGVLQSHIQNKSKSLGYSNKSQLSAKIELDNLKRLEIKKNEEELRKNEIASKYSKLSEDYLKINDC